MPSMLCNFSWKFLLVWRRNFQVFLHIWYVDVIPPLMEPLIYYLAFGLGLSSFMQTISYAGMSLSYQTYVAAGIVSIAVMNYAFFECTYSSFVRMEIQRTYEAITATPLLLEDVILGEISWGATRSVATGAVIVLILQFFAPVNWMGFGWILLAGLLGGWFFAALGMLFTGILPTIDKFNYPVFFLITPMTFLSGTFFPVESFGPGLAKVAELLPLTHVTRLIRNAYLGIHSGREWFSATYLAVLLPIMTLAAIAAVRKRVIR